MLDDEVKLRVHCPGRAVLHDLLEAYGFVRNSAGVLRVHVDKVFQDSRVWVERYAERGIIQTGAHELVEFWQFGGTAADCMAKYDI